MMGAHALGLVGRRKELQPQQYLMAEVLNRNDRFTSILMPRRSTKTTTLLAWIIGRCLSRPDYYAAYTVMTTGKMTRARFLKDVCAPIERMYPNERTRPFRLLRGAGSEHIEFTNGSVLAFVAPKGDSFRSDAFDLIVLDEAGEPEAELTEDVLTAALPTMDTRPEAMIVKAGTAGEFREGNMLWEELLLGRAGLERHAILEYAVTDEPSIEDLDDWDTVEQLLLQSHPGVGALTPMEVLQDNWRGMKRDRFAREYLGVFGRAVSANFIDPHLWHALADTTATMPDPPKHFALAFAIHPFNTSAALVAAWRVDGRAHLLVLAHRRGTEWVYAETLRVARKYGVPITYDSGTSSSQVHAERLLRARPKPKVDPHAWAQVSAAASLLMAEIEIETVTHYDQDSLNTAVMGATRRGHKDSKRWAFGRAHDEADITALEAAALALYAFDSTKVRPAPTSMVF
jgi:hypothetical protein